MWPKKKKLPDHGFRGPKRNATRIPSARGRENGEKGKRYSGIAQSGRNR